MSYLVLARKWRPQTFEDVIGQEHVTRALRNSLKENHLAHALLFSGPRGVGKTSIARILAKALNCENGPAPAPCNECGICNEITEGAAVDVIEVDGASNRGIDEIRQLRETIRFQPVRCRSRVFIIDEVHMLTKEAFNALLKTLEEPPPHVFFIFATTEPHRIPATIHSRCQHYEFRRLSTLKLADHLDHIVRAEGMKLTREATLLLAREADGSVRDSLSLLDQVAAYGAESVEDVHEALGVVGARVLSRLALAILRGDVEEALFIASDIYRLGVDFTKFTGDLTAFFRDILVLKRTSIDKAAKLMDLEKGQAAELADNFSGFTANSLMNIINVLMKGQASLATSTSPRLSLDLLLIRLCSLNEIDSADELLQEIRKTLETGGISQASRQDSPPGTRGNLASPPFNHKTGPETSPRQESARHAHNNKVAQKDDAAGHRTASRRARQARRQASLTDAAVVKTGQSEVTAPAAAQSGLLSGEQKAEIKESHPSSPANDKPKELDDASWNSFIKHACSLKPAIGNTLKAAMARIDPKSRTVTLKCKTPMHQEFLSDQDYSSTLHEMAGKFFGAPVAVKITNRDNSPASPPGTYRSGKKEQLLEDPVVRYAIKSFNARISNYQLASSKTSKKD